jgi:hypothetical protein
MTDTLTRSRTDKYDDAEKFRKENHFRNMCKCDTTFNLHSLSFDINILLFCYKLCLSVPVDMFAVPRDRARRMTSLFESTCVCEQFF